MNQSIDDTVKFVYGHAEAFVGNQSVRTLLRSSFRDRVKVVVIDEAQGRRDAPDCYRDIRENTKKKV